MKLSQITLYGDHYSNTTLVSNSFIDEYMKSANEAQIKIYLYLLRCMNAALPVSVSSIADQFNYTEKDVLRSLMYWDKCGLIRIDFDASKNVVGIRLHDFSRATTPITAPPAEEIQPSSEYAEDCVSAPTKPFYSLDRMKEFKSRQEVQELFFMTEKYMGKTLSSSDMNSILYMYEGLHLPVDLIEYLIEYCVNNNHKSMRYIERTALAWSEEGISSVKDAKANNNRYKKEYYSVLKAFGLSGRNPVESDMDYIRRWTTDYCFDMDIIIEACNRTMKSIAKPSFDYADTILKNWKSKNVHHKADIAFLDETYQKAKESKPDYSKLTAADSTTGNNKFKNFKQRSYNFDELEKELIQN